jgi:signal transduction histidine kinase
MTGDELSGPGLPQAGAKQLLDAIRRLRPPVRSRRFWVVQAGVLFVAFLDELILDYMGVQLPFGIPNAAITALLVIPVIYAAMNFGVRGGVGTALWATALLVPDWFFITHMTRTNIWVEAGNLAILNAVAIVVGQRVEREGHARRRAEKALRDSEAAETRYRALFEEQHAPVLVTDSTGLVSGANAAATRLFGAGVPGRLLPDLVGATVTAMLDGSVPRLSVGDRVFVPKARTLDVGTGEGLVQIVLVEATEEERRAREQRAYAANLVTVEEDERRRLAQDLHDDELQTLTYLVRMLELMSDDPRLPPELAERVRRNGELATGVVDVLGTVIHGLRPPVLDDFGVVAAVRQLVAEVRARHGISIRLRVSGNQVRLSAEDELAVYRVAQEALSNVVRHAQATRTRVDLQFGEQIVLSVTDDGCGIPDSLDMSAGSGGGLGLIGMRERVNLVGGRLEVRARTPHGTMVRATLLGAKPAARPAPDAVLT